MSSTYQTICFLGGDSLECGSAFSSRQRLIKRTKLVSESLIAEILGGAQEVADAIVGDPGPVAHVRGPHEAVVDHHGDAPRSATPSPRPHAASGGIRR